MSVNSTINQNFLAEVEALANLLEEYVRRREGASTQEDRVLIESEAIVLFESLLDLDYKLQKIKKGDYPEYENYIGNYRTYLYLVEVGIAKLRKLTELFVQHFNSQQFALADLLGRLKRIRQKKAALALWSGDDAKFVLAEHFLNLDNLDNKFVGDDVCDVDVTQGVLTLPVRDVKPIAVQTIVVGSGSNGQAGNSDPTVTTNNISPKYAINGDPNNWFEYERLDSGPLKLSLILELPKAEVVNNLVLAPLNIGQAYSFEVEDIVFNSGSSSTSVHELIGESDRDRMVVKSAGNDNEWSLTFLPTVAKTITVKLKQSQAHQVPVLTANGARSRRNRYAVGLVRVGVNQLRFDGVGAINSTEQILPGGLYLGIPVVSVWPPKPELFDALMEVSLDGGETWIEAENVDDGIGSSVLLDGTASSVVWRLQVERDDDALDNVTSFTEEPGGIKKVNHFMRAVSKEKSPTSFALPEKPARGIVFVLQPRVARRGDRARRIKFGTGNGVVTKFDLPFSPVDAGVDPETMKVYVDGTQYQYEEDDTSIGSDEWAFGDDFTEVVFGTPVTDSARVEFVLDEERMLFEQRADGYYHQMELLFDPDEDNINIQYLPRKASRKTMLLPRDRKVIKLGVSNIETDNFSLSSSSGVIYTQVENRTDLLATSNSYMLDNQNGLLWLNSVLDSDSVRVSFDHQSSDRISNDDFDVVYDENTVRPWGVRIAPEAFQAIEATDTIGGALVSRVDPVEGSWGPRTAKISSADDAATLSYDYVVKGSLRVSSDLFDTTYVPDKPQEVEFIDGKSEFLGLVPMNSESTVETTLEVTEEVVSFTLASGALWYGSFDVLFGNTSVFATDVGPSIPASLGEYSISNEGVVDVYVGAGGTLPGSIKIFYYYQDPEFEAQNKYSVDYKNGVIYGGSDLQAGATIKYKASSHKAAYNVAAEIDRYSYDRQANAVEVRTEGIGSINNLVKIVWAKSTDKSSLRAFRDYFSPLFSLLALRFN